MSETRVSLKLSHETALLVQEHLKSIRTTACLMNDQLEGVDLTVRAEAIKHAIMEVLTAFPNVYCAILGWVEKGDAPCSAERLSTITRVSSYANQVFLTNDLDVYLAQMMDFLSKRTELEKYEILDMVQHARGETRQ